MQPTKYFLYIRKSTDEEDRQVLSLEAQLAELKEYAEKESLEIIETFVEKKTAKVPGREIFNSMLNKIEGGLPHLIGILAWHPDRLSRNSVDGEAEIRKEKNKVVKTLAPPSRARVFDILLPISINLWTVILNFATI